MKVRIKGMEFEGTQEDIEWAVERFTDNACHKQSYKQSSTSESCPVCAPIRESLLIGSDFS